jgi:hypothetical protein
MRLTSRFLLGALLATIYTGTATAETPATASAPDTLDLAAITDPKLDDAFERSSYQNSDRFMSRLGRPTTMDCAGGPAHAGPETCTVTAPEYESVVPAALAQR